MSSAVPVPIAGEKTGLPASLMTNSNCVSQSPYGTVAYILFYEYFLGDNGAGLGASHQTGWIGIIARILDMFARGSAADSFQASEG